MRLLDFIGHYYGKGNRRIYRIWTCKDKINQIRAWCSNNDFSAKTYFMPCMKEDNSLLCGLGKIEWSDGSVTIINILDILKDDWRVDFVEKEELRNIENKLVSSGEAIALVDVKEFIEC